jgi:hypothetical protein
MVWKGAGGWLIVSQARPREAFPHRLDHLPLARDAFQRLGDRLAQPAQLVRTAAGAAAGGRHDDALARQVVGERLACRLPAGERRDRGGLRGGLFGGQLVLACRRLQLLQLQFHLVEPPRLAFGAHAVEVAAQLLDLQLQIRDERLIAGGFRLGLGGIGLRGVRTCLGLRQGGA